MLRAAVAEPAEADVVRVAGARLAALRRGGQEGRAAEVLVVLVRGEEAHVDLLGARARRPGDERALEAAVAGCLAGEVEVGGVGGEGDARAAAVDLHVVSGAVRLHAAVAERHAPDPLGAQVAHEGVGLAVGVAGDEVAGVRHERDAVRLAVLRVAVEAGRVGAAVGGSAAHALGCDLGRAGGLPGLAVGVGELAAAAEHEHVGEAVGVARDDVGGVRLVGDVRGALAVLGEHGVTARTVWEAAVDRAAEEVRLPIGRRVERARAGGEHGGGERCGGERSGGDPARRVHSSVVDRQPGALDFQDLRLDSRA